MIPYDEIGREIRHLRKERKLTLAEVAETTGLHGPSARDRARRPPADARRGD
jgi:transcriptional regulator with XRE-family HTH domain